jgi:hypothetical protein
MQSVLWFERVVDRDDMLALPLEAYEICNLLGRRVEQNNDGSWNHICTRLLKIGKSNQYAIVFDRAGSNRIYEITSRGIRHS